MAARAAPQLLLPFLTVSTSASGPRAVPLLIPAIVCALLGVVGTAVAPSAGLTTPQTEPAFSSTALRTVVAALPVLLALVLHAARRPAAAAGALAGSGALAVGLTVADLQLVFDANSAQRPELLHPHRLTVLHASTGTWVLLAGGALAVLAGALAAFSAPRDGDAEPDVGVWGRRVAVAALGLGVLVALAMCFGAPYHSDDPYLPAAALFGQPGAALAGGLLLVVGLVLAPVLGVLWRSREFGGGALLGAALGLIQFGLPQLAGGVAVAGLSTAAEPYWVLAVAVILLALGAAGVRPPRERLQAAPSLPGVRRLTAVAGGVGLLAALCGLGAVFVPLLRRPTMVTDLNASAHTALLPASVLVGVLAAGLLVPRIAETLRPVFEVGAAVLPLALSAVADSIATATSAVGMHIAVTGWVWLLVGSFVLVVVAACFAVVAGGVEREDVDTSSHPVRPLVTGLGGLGFVLGVFAFGFPLLTGDDYVPAGLWTQFRIGSWGMIVVLLVVLGAAGLAGFSRSPRAAGLLGGSALVFVVYAVGYPFGAADVHGAAPGLGLWAGILAAVVFGIGALVCAARREYAPSS